LNKFFKDTNTAVIFLSSVVIDIKDKLLFFRVLTVILLQAILKFPENDISGKYIHSLIKVAKCAKCNEELIEGNSFCEICGEPRVATSPPTPKPPQVTSPPPPPPLTPAPGPPQEPQQASTQSDVIELSKTLDTPKTGNLVFPDDSKIKIDESQRLVGRADLLKFSNDDSKLISRGHFTVYEENEKYYIIDGNTIVQDKPSAHHTFLNDEDITDQGKVEFSDGDIIKVSEVQIRFKVE